MEENYEGENQGGLGEREVSFTLPRKSYGCLKLSHWILSLGKDDEFLDRNKNFSPSDINQKAGKKKGILLHSAYICY